MDIQNGTYLFVCVLYPIKPTDNIEIVKIVHSKESAEEWVCNHIRHGYEQTKFEIATTATGEIKC